MVERLGCTAVRGVLMVLKEWHFRMIPAPRSSLIPPGITITNRKGTQGHPSSRPDAETKTCAFAESQVAT